MTYVPLLYMESPSLGSSESASYIIGNSHVISSCSSFDQSNFTVPDSIDGGKNSHQE